MNNKTNLESEYYCNVCDRVTKTIGYDLELEIAICIKCKERPLAIQDFIMGYWTGGE